MVDFSIVAISRSLAALLGYPPGHEVLTPRSLSAVFIDPKPVQRRMREVLGRERKPGWDSFATEARRKDGSGVRLETTVERIFLRQTEAALCSFRDVTSPRERERERRLRELNVALLDQARTSAIRETANALSHRINQPRAAMRNWLSAARMAAQQGGNAAEIEALLRRAMQEGDRIEAVLEGVEEMASLAPCERGLSNLNVLAADIARAVRDASAGSSLSVDLQIWEGLGPVLIREDPMRRALIHLASCGAEEVVQGRPSVAVIRTFPCGYGARAISVSLQGPQARVPDRFDLDLVETVVKSDEGLLEVQCETDRVDLSVVLPKPLMADGASSS